MDYFEFQTDIYGNKMATPKKLRKIDNENQNFIQASFPKYRKCMSTSSPEKILQKSKTITNPYTKQFSSDSIAESETYESTSIIQSQQSSDLLKAG